MNKELKRLALELGLPVKVVEKVYRSYWVFIKETIEKLPLDKDLSEEEFNNLRTSFSLPYLGKLYCTYGRWKAIREYDDKHKEDKTDV